jgi:2-polyprenyl-3-methyl-5-hydroxy-6-metoxy-1,4-benzoquinol methylase
MKKKIDINKNTENTLLNQKKKFKINGGISECIKYENKFFFKSFDLVGKDLIEFGCGIFPSCLGINKDKMPKTYIATDTSKKIIKNAKINDNRPIYKVCDLEKKINIKKKFDIIVLKGVLHHTKNPEKILSKLKKILKKNGIIIISEPNLTSVLGNFLKWFLAFAFKISMEDSPYGQYSFKKINKCIKIANLRIVNKWYTVLILLILTGDYGRIMVFPDNRFLFSLFITIENFLFYIFKYIGIAKFLYFKLNIVLKKN